VVQTLGLLVCRTPFLKACRRRYGEVVALRTLFGPPFVVVFDREIVGEVLRTPARRARAGAANAAAEPLHGTSSLLLLDGDEHLRQRRLLLPAFHGERMRAYEAVIRGAADRVIDGWPVGEPFSLMPSMHSLTLDVIMRAVFGVGDDAHGSELERGVRAMLSASGGRSFERHRRRVDELVHGEIARRRGAADLGERTDVLSTLLGAGREDDGRAMTDAELHDELITLLVAGHETTASALTWAFELILRDRAVLERLRRSLAVGDHDYLDAVIKEALRLRPVVTGLGRLVSERPLRVGAYDVRPGVEVTPAIDSIHASPANYARPKTFLPERFLTQGASTAARLGYASHGSGPAADAWLPFGGGTRRCIGASFASFEMRIVIARVLERTQLRPLGSRPERGVRRRVTPPTRPALARALRRGRRSLPRRGARVIQTAPPRSNRK
jgi:cytochrome P450 family 135